MPRKRTVSDIKSTLLRPALTSDFEVQIALPTADGFTPHASIICLLYTSDAPDE